MGVIVRGPAFGLQTRFAVVRDAILVLAIARVTALALGSVARVWVNRIMSEPRPG